MNFIHVEFLYFFAIVFVLYWLLNKRKWQNLLLIVSSAIFYGWVHPWFLILLYGSAVLDYQMGLLMRSDPDNKKRYLILSLIGNLGMLGYFKYANFFMDNVIFVFESMGIHTDWTSLNIILPVGISFFTFQTMSYSIDIYRGSLEPRKQFVDYLVFISFFPQLVAGPVERASTLLPQMEKERRLSWEQFRSGLSLALWGAFKKVCIADTIALYVNRIFELQEPSGAMIWAATLGFTIQILTDFAGYTDIARGTARILGFELMENFKNPYIAKNPSDFWRRWHVSFSTWIRDYLYIPFGGSRGTFSNTTKATFGAMLLSGLWHGASWTFVLWGAYHAAILTGYRLVTKRIPKEIRKSTWGAPFAVSIMFGFTVVGWLIFRETNIGQLLHYFTLNPFEGSSDQFLVAGIMFAMCLTCSIPLVLALTVEKLLLPRVKDSIWFQPMMTTFWGLCILSIMIMHRPTNNDFIYFQF
ncbi:MAG: membrane-bound O-acyltransferase family protein [Proteobacteria bacterium]|nr:membrane-bound O-acyltransferase family protein [Pseudomonadota bacterium]